MEICFCCENEAELVPGAFPISVNHGKRFVVTFFFQVEVERTLLAMDGVIVILDASKGVQAQTQTVWRQAVKFGLPSLVYLNKMDKPGADVSKCLEQLEKKLGVVALPLQLPFGAGKNFTGTCHLLNQEKLGGNGNHLPSELSR